VTPLLVFFGAGLGGIARYGVGIWFQRVLPAFPWGTLLVNLTGSLLLGAIVAALETSQYSLSGRALLGIGFCGGYTTFSALSFETVRMLQDGEWGLATLYAFGSVTAGLLCMFLGMKLGALLKT
jgi:CrcB protein